MRMIYQVVHSYGISILLFTIFIKLITLPGTYKTQVNQARMGLIGDKLVKIRKAFPNNAQRQQEEQQKLYAAEGINPSAGCLMNLLTLFIIFPVYRVVMQPLTYILRISSETLSKAQTLLVEFLNNQGVEKAERTVAARPELMLLKYGKSNPEIFSGIEGFTDQIAGFKNTFLGFDLAGIPSLKPDGGWTFTAVMLVLLPVLSGAANLALTLITQHHNKTANPNGQQMTGAMNMMLYLSPLMTIWIGMSVPAGLSFYWMCNSILSLIVTLLLYKYLSGKRLEKINEKEKAKQIAKGPTWMQRMMEQSQQMQAEQNGTLRRDGNRTSYSDGDDGMSRKERSEYERKLIEAARRRVAEKYGDPLPGDNDQDA